MTTKHKPFIHAAILIAIIILVYSFFFRGSGTGRFMNIDEDGL